MGNSNFQSLLTMVLLLALGAVGYLWITGELVSRQRVIEDGISGAAETGLLQTETQFRERLAELRMQRDKVQRGVQRLEGLKLETVNHLKSKGITSGKDYLNSKDPDVKYAVVNLKEWVAQIEKITKEVTHYDEAINSIGVMLDKLERDRISDSVSLSEDEYMELQKVIIDLNERLEIDTDILEDQALGDLLDSEMGAPDSQPSPK